MLLPEKPLSHPASLAYAAHMATQFAPPNHSRAPQDKRGKTPPASPEDIGSVLERFHKWAGHKAEPVRELSYEEALARSRRHRYAEEELTGPQPVTAAAAPVPAPPPPIPFPLVKEPPTGDPVNKPTRPASAKSAENNPRTATQHDAPQEANEAQADSAPARPFKKTAVREKVDAAAKPDAAKKKIAKKSATKVVKAKAAAEAPKPSAQPAREIPAAAMQAPEQQAPAQQMATQQTVAAPGATFAQVLAAQFELPEAEPAGISPARAGEPAGMPAARPALSTVRAFAVAPLPEDAPAVHLTVRLASSEREALREHARDLGVTPSAYVRQCALEVDALRSELDHVRLAQAQADAELALAREEAKAAKSEIAISLSTRKAHSRDQESDWFQRLRNFVFPRKTKGQAFAMHA